MTELERLTEENKALLAICKRILDTKAISLADVIEIKSRLENKK